LLSINKQAEQFGIRDCVVIFFCERGNYRSNLIGNRIYLDCHVHYRELAMTDENYDTVSNSGRLLSAVAIALSTPETTSLCSAMMILIFLSLPRIN